MKILISAIACNPYQGSESYFGWSAIKCLARDHELCVITSGRSRPDLERAQAEGLIPSNVRFVYAGHFQTWHPNRMRARLQGWREYVDFSKAILPVASQLHAVEKFNLAHHVTYATWRVASPLWQLDMPFVLGPIGGYEQFPLQLFPILSPTAQAFELARMASNIKAKLSPSVQNCIRRAAHVFVANAETEQLVKTMRGSTKGVSVLSAAFYSEAQIQAFTKFAPDKQLDSPLRLFAGGNMEGRKGVALALAALARVKKSGIKFHYRVGAQGPEIIHLKKLAAKLNLENEVLFADGLYGEAYHRELGAAHIFLLPSLRESAGLTMMEAMLAEGVPVVVNGGGPEFIVASECGYKIPITNHRQMVSQLAEAIIAIDQNRKIIKEKGRAAAQRIATCFSEDNYRKTINAVYQSVAGFGK